MSGVIVVEETGAVIEVSPLPGPPGPPGPPASEEELDALRAEFQAGDAAEASARQDAIDAEEQARIASYGVLESDLATKQPLSEKGQALGYASLDGGGKVPVTQLPSSIMEYKGTWNAATNTTGLGGSLADGIGDTGDVYRVNVGATRNLGSGNISFDVGDYVIYNGTTWEKSDTTDSVASVAGKTGNVSLVASDIGGLGTAATKDAGAAGSAGKVLNADDPTTTNQRTPTDGSVTAAKVADALKPSQGAGGSTESLRALGTGTGLALPGSYLDTATDLGGGSSSDSKVPSQLAAKTAIEARTPLIMRAGKPNQTGRNSTTTLTDDPDLQLAIPAPVSAAFYQVEVNLYLKGAGTTADWQFTLVWTGSGGGEFAPLSTGASSRWGNLTTAQSPAALTPFGTAETFGSANVHAQGIWLKGRLYATSAGTLKLQWAQNTSDGGNSILQTGSNMIVTRVVNG